MIPLQAQLEVSQAICTVADQTLLAALQEALKNWGFGFSVREDFGVWMLR